MTTIFHSSPMQAATQQAARAFPRLLWQAVPADSSADLRTVRERALAHKQRCRQLPPVSIQEADSLVAQFLARSGVTRCPPAYAAPVR